MAEAYSVDRSKAVKLTIDNVRSKNTTRRVVEIARHVDSLSVINKLALAGMFGALGEAYAVTPDNPNPAMVVAITLYYSLLQFQKLTAGLGLTAYKNTCNSISYYI